MSVSRIACVLFCATLIASGLPSRAQFDGDGDPTDAPSNLVASGAFSGISVRSLNLSWQDNSDTDAGFIVEVKVGVGPWTPIAYTPNDYITLYSATGYSALGYYSGLTAGGTKSFRVRAKYPSDPPMPQYSNTVQVTMPPSPTCSTPKQLSPVPSLLAHANFPLDLAIASNINGPCLPSGVDYQYCLISGPAGFVVDFNSGVVLWTPAKAAAPATISIGFIAAGTPCTVASSIATTSFTVTVDDNTMTTPLFRDYRSEEAGLKVVGRAYDNFASFAIHSSPLCAVYDGINCPLTQEAPPDTDPVGPETLGLATWNIAPYGNGSRRLLNLIIQSPTKTNSAIYNPVIIDRTSYTSKWPKRLSLGSVRGALAVDLNLDGHDEIIATSRDGLQGGPYVWALDGDLLWQAPGGGLTESEVAVGDVDGDGKNDVVTSSKYKLRVFRDNGDLLAQALVTDPTTFTTGGASLADIDGDRDLEILVNTMDGTTAAKTHIYKYNGTTTLVEYSADWPKAMSYPSASSRPSTADLNGDGHLDVIVDNHQYVYAWSTDPSHPLGWTSNRVALPSNLYPLAIKVNGGANPNGFAQPSVADLDGNGTPDIIVVGQNIISPSGTYLRCLNGTSCTAPATKIPTAVGMTAAIGEFISWVPGPEILLGGYVFSSDASYVPPLITLGGGTNVALSTIVDGGLDMEGLPETYALMGSLDQTQYTANISAFESNGEIDDDYPKALYGNTKCGSAPQLGDFDGDGNRDVLVEITDATYGAVVALYRTSPGTPFNADNNPWPMAGHDAQRTGRSYCKQQRQACSTDAQCCGARCNAGTCQ